MSGRLRVKNFERFQHYKDRTPPWIKLYNSLLDDYEFTQMEDKTKAHLVLIWLLASRHEGNIPNDPEWIASRIGATDGVDIPTLVELGFLVPCEDESPARDRCDWSSRYVPKDVRAAVFARDSNMCRKCGAKTGLEIDHIVPIRMGGSGDINNLQVLCKSCNRRKRGEIQTAEQDARQTLLGVWDLRSQETETETETKIPAAPGVDKSQSPEYKRLMAAIEQKTGSEQCWQKKHRPMWEQALDVIGFDGLMELVRTRDFKNVTYFMRSGPGGGPCLLEAEMQKARAKAIQETAGNVARGNVQGLGALLKGDL